MVTLRRIMTARSFGEAPTTTVKVERVEQLGPIRRVADAYDMTFERGFADGDEAGINAAVVDALTAAGVLPADASVTWEI